MLRVEQVTRLGIVAVLLFYCISCVLPVGYYEGKYLEEGVTASGWGLLIYGWMALPIVGLPAVGWFANPLLGAGLYLLWKSKKVRATICAATAAIVSLFPFLFFPNALHGSFQWKPMPTWVFDWYSEGVLVSARNFQLGFFIWIATHWLFLGTCLVDLRQSLQTRRFFTATTESAKTDAFNRS